MSTVLKVKKEHSKKPDYIRKNAEKLLTYQEVSDLYDKVENREDRITVPIKLITYNENDPINIKLFTIDGTKLPKSKNIPYDDEEKESFIIYPLAYNKIAIKYEEEKSYIIEILDIMSNEVLNTIEHTGLYIHALRRIVYNNKFYIFRREYTTIYDISTNTTSKKKVIPGLEAGVFKVMNNKLIYTHYSGSIYDLDTDNNKLNLVHKSEGDYYYYNGEYLVTIKDNTLKIGDKIVKLSSDMIGYNRSQWFGDILVITYSKYIIKVMASTQDVELNTISYNGILNIISSNLLCGFNRDSIDLFDISDIKNVIKTTNQHTDEDSYDNRNPHLIVLSPTQIIVKREDKYFYYIIKNNKTITKIDEIELNDLSSILPVDPRDIQKISNMIKTKLISTNIKNLIAKFI